MTGFIDSIWKVVGKYFWNIYPTRRPYVIAVIAIHYATFSAASKLILLLYPGIF